MIKAHPILFSTPMVQAIINESKTETRRTKNLEGIDPKSTEIVRCNHWPKQGNWAARYQVDRNPDRYEVTDVIKCPYGEVGDVLWVRETFGELKDYCDHDELPGCPREEWSLGFKYKADNYVHDSKDGFWSGWKPSIHMPFTVCRLFLKITHIRVERLWDITDQDAMSEGILRYQDEHGRFRFKDYMVDDSGYGDPSVDYPTCGVPKFSFRTLWESINGEESWNQNPWVWVIEFERMEEYERP